MTDINFLRVQDQECTLSCTKIFNDKTKTAEENEGVDISIRGDVAPGEDTF